MNHCRALMASSALNSTGMSPQMSDLKPRRLVVPQRETSECSAQIIGSKTDESHDVSGKARVQDSSALAKNMMTRTSVNHESASITPPTISDAPPEEGKFISNDASQRGQTTFSCDCRSSSMVDRSCSKCGNALLADGQKKVQFSLGTNSRCHGSVDMDTTTATLLTHMGSLALTEMECDVNNQPDFSSAPSHNLEVDLTSRSNDEIFSLRAKGTAGVQNQVNPVRNFLHTIKRAHVLLTDDQKKVQFALGTNSRSHEMECDVNNQPDFSSAPGHNLEVDLEDEMMKYIFAGKRNRSSKSG